MLKLNRCNFITNEKSMRNFKNKFPLKDVLYSWKYNLMLKSKLFFIETYILSSRIVYRKKEVPNMLTVSLLENHTGTGTQRERFCVKKIIFTAENSI